MVAILQHNCRGAYPITIAALELGLELEVGLVCLQEPYRGTFNHRGYLLYWPNKGEQDDYRVAIAVRRDLLDQMVIEARTDLVSHPYVMTMDIWELGTARERVRRTRIINCYDNWLGANHRWQGGDLRRRRAIEDINWGQIIEGRCLILGDFNAHSALWNPHIRNTINAGPLETLIEEHDLYINNDPDTPTRPKVTPGISIIDLALSSPSLGPLPNWAIDKDHPTGSDHETILLEWDDLGQTRTETSKAITGWQIEALIGDEEAKTKATQTWKELRAGRLPLSDKCSTVDIADEALWIEETMVEVLNQCAKPIRLSPFSKRWWGPEIKEARRAYAQARRAWKTGTLDGSDHREARNTLYRTIRKAKRECWETFLGGSDQTKDSLSPEDTARCWQALRYTGPKSKAMGATPTLIGPEGQVAITLAEKETLIREIAFPLSSNSDADTETIPQGKMHTEIKVEMVQRALFSQAIQKAPGVDRINFRALRLLWDWDSPRIIALARQCFRLGVHPQTWKTAKGILLHKPNKPNHLIKAYRVISLLNCMGKVIEKIAAEAIADYCESAGVLHQGQMGSRRNRSAIDAVACLIQEVFQGWEQQQLTGAAFLDMVGAFDHTDPARLVKRMGELGIDRDLMRWVQSFLTDRKVLLVIDGHQGQEHSINSGVPQGSPVSPILFIIHISGIFKAIEEAVPGVRALSFADDIGLLAHGNSVDQVCVQLQQAGEVAIQWGHTNGIKFDPKKTEAALFTRKTGRAFKEQVQRAKITIGGHQKEFNKEATKWLGVWLDTGLTLKTHYQTRLQKAQRAEKRIRTLCKQQGLAPGLIRKIQKAAVQASALYGAELWWQGQKDRVGGFQRLINQQARAITGMFRTTPIGPLVKEAAMEPAESLLEARQLGYTVRLLGLPNDQPVRQILPITFREGDHHAQPGEQPIGDRAWAETQSARGTWSLGQHLARQLAKSLKTDPSAGFEEITKGTLTPFSGCIKVLPSQEALEAAMATRQGLTLWSDGSRLENGRVGAGVAWQTPQGVWRTQETPMGTGKEVFDAELTGAYKALEIALKNKGQGPVTVLLDSQAAIARLGHQRIGPGQSLAIHANTIATALKARGRPVTIQWVPGHHGIEGNERADQAAKSAAQKPPRNDQGGLSLAHVNRACTEIVRTQRQQWLTKMLGRRTLEAQRAYRAQTGWKQDPIIAAAPKKIASRYYQLKVGHAAIRTFLKGIRVQDSEACRGCQAPKESVHHLLFECREWRRQREDLYKALRKAKVALPSMAEDHPEGRLLGDPRASKALLQFLRDTRVGCLPESTPTSGNSATEADNWGLEALDEAERDGEG
jgi:ribonuclease HI